MKPAILCINAVISVSLVTPVFGQQILDAKTQAEPTLPAPELKKSPVLGSVLPEDLPPLFPELTDWLNQERIRFYGWIDSGYTYSSTGSGLLANAPTPNRFGDETLLNGAWLIFERQLAEEGWSWGFRSDFYVGSDAALLRPQNGFGPEDNPRLGTDFRQLYLSLHMPVLSEGGVDLQLGRQNVPIGYETIMGPYRPMYSESYFWIHFQVGSTSTIATWHATKQLDLLAGVVFGYNTFFNLRGSSPCYIAKATYSLDTEKRATAIATVYTGPEPAPAALGHVGSWQTVSELELRYHWSRRLTQVFQIDGSWDSNDPAVKGTSPTYGVFSMATVHVNEKLDVNARGEWFWDKDGARTGLAANYGEVAVGLDVMPNPWINFRPELRGDFASEPAFGSVSSSHRERSQFTAAFDVILKFH